jgi:hypothetical protein
MKWKKKSYVNYWLLPFFQCFFAMQELLFKWNKCEKIVKDLDAYSADFPHDGFFSVDQLIFPWLGEPFWNDCSRFDWGIFWWTYFEGFRIFPMISQKI